jgi:hypothetical protein
VHFEFYSFEFKSAAMKQSILLFFLLKIFVANGQSVQWAKNQPLGEASLAINTCVDEHGNIYVAGNQSCTHDDVSSCPNNVQNGGFLIKYDPAGNVLWSKVSNTFYVTDMALNKNGEPLILESFGFTQYDVNGNMLWTKNNLFPAATYKVRFDSNGDFYVAGLFNGTVNFSSTIQLVCSSSSNYLFVSKFDTSGNCIWAIQSNNFARLLNFKLDLAGNCYLSGHYAVQLNLNGTTINTPGGYYSNGYIAKIKPNGQVEWLLNIGDHIQGHEEIECLDIDSKGNVYATGNFFNAPLEHGGFTVGSASGGNFAAKFNKNGNCMFIEEVDYRTTSIETTNHDNLLIAGYGVNFHGNVLSTDWQNGDGSFFIVKCDSNFTMDWVMQPTGKVGYRVIDDDQGNVYFFGNIQGSSSIGTYHLTGPSISADNNSDMLIVKLSDETFVGMKPILSSDENDLKIYPTPTTGEFQISYIAPQKSDLTINILDTKGAIIYSETIKGAEAEYSRSFDLRKYPKGIYTFQITSRKERVVRKIVLH